MERREFLLKSIAGAVAVGVAARGAAQEPEAKSAGGVRGVVISTDDGSVYTIPFDKLEKMKADSFGQSGRVSEAGLKSHYGEVHKMMDMGVRLAQMHGEGGQVFCYLINLASLK